MSDANGVTLSVKAMINKEKTRVIFVEAGRDFTDVLLSFLALPLGKILKLLENHYGDEAPAVGSLSTLYKSVSNLDESHFATKSAKQMLLNPRTSFAAQCRNLKLDVSDSQPLKGFICNGPCSRKIGFLYDPNPKSCDCGRMMDKEVSIDDLIYDHGRAFLAMDDAMSFLISDNLRVIPSSAGFSETLGSFGDLNGAELMDVTFGINEIIALVKFSLISKTPLTNVILSASPKLFVPVTGFLSNPVASEGDGRRITLKLTVHSFSSKFLFAQAEDDFVDLLFSFLTFPLGLVESLLENNTCLNNIDNLYRSLAKGIDDKYLKSPATKNRLMKPNLPYGYTSKDQFKFLPLGEDGPPHFFGWKFPKGPGNYVKKPRTFMITDDLRVTNFHMTSGIRFLSQHNILLRDVSELEVEMGPEEVLGMLKASLTSTSVLSHVKMINYKRKRSLTSPPAPTPDPMIHHKSKKICKEER